MNGFNFFILFVWIFITIAVTAFMILIPRFDRWRLQRRAKHIDDTMAAASVQRPQRRPSIGRQGQRTIHAPRGTSQRRVRMVAKLPY